MSIEGLSVHYLGRESWVLESVDLTHLRGRVTAVIGPSGCGKTTLVRALCGLIPHCLPSEYAGSLRLAGTEVADASVQSLAETVAYVGQSPDTAVVTRTVHDDVTFPLQNLCLTRPEITARVEEALRAVGTHRAHLGQRSLSSTMTSTRYCPSWTRSWLSIPSEASSPSARRARSSRGTAAS